RKEKLMLDEEPVPIDYVTLPSTRTAQPRSPVSPCTAEPPERLEEIYAALVLGVRDYVNKNGFPGVVIGISGGIDSALTACIAADALGAERVTLVSMPSMFSSNETQSDAARIARNLGVRFHEIPIKEVQKAYDE